MLVMTSEPNSGPPSRTPSLLDSPTLARVERARLRHENGSLQNENSLERSLLSSKQSLLAGRIPIAAMTGPIKRGLLWQQRDRLFSRWKERYFILTRDYLHCFKRASGSATDRISDMGQFIFKVKLVDVEKVEWLNRRSFSVIGLFLGREGRVLLRSDHGLEDWFELLEECTMVSKERREALKVTQGPRSRASLAAPPSHTSLQTHNFGLVGTYSSALDDWLMTGRNRINGNLSGTNPFLLSDSVPDLSNLNNENHHHYHNHHHLHHNGISTNHSTPQKIPYSNNTSSYYSNGYSSQNSSYSNGFYGTPSRRILINKFGSTNIVDEEGDDDEVEVQLRRPLHTENNINDNGNNISNSNNNNQIENEWMYRRPKGPTDTSRHSVQTDLDHSANDSGLDTPSSTHRRCSVRGGTGGGIASADNHHNQRDSTETTVSSSRGTLLNSPGGSLRGGGGGNNQHQQQHHHQQQHNYINGAMINALNSSRYSVQERVYKGRINHHDDEPPQQSANRNPDLTYEPINRYNQQKTNTSTTNTTSSSCSNNGSAIFRERYQHPALAAIINEAQGMKFRDRSYSDCHQCPKRLNHNNNSNNNNNNNNNNNVVVATNNMNSSNNNNSSAVVSPRRGPFFPSPTRV